MGMDYELTITAELKNLSVLRHFVKETAAKMNANGEAVEDLIQAVDESATNIIVHGYKGQEGTIEARMGREGDRLVVSLRDRAPLFDPTQVPPPDLMAPPEKRCFGGLGMHFVRNFTDKVVYQITPEGGNELTMWKTVK